MKHQELTALRKQAVMQVQNGESPETVARALGINRTIIYDRPTAYRTRGWSALEVKPRFLWKRSDWL